VAGAGDESSLDLACFLPIHSNSQELLTFLVEFALDVGDGVLLDLDLSDLYREFSSSRLRLIVSLKTKSEFFFSSVLGEPGVVFGFAAGVGSCSFSSEFCLRNEFIGLVFILFFGGKLKDEIILAKLISISSSSTSLNSRWDISLKSLYIANVSKSSKGFDLELNLKPLNRLSPFLLKPFLGGSSGGALVLLSVFGREKFLFLFISSQVFFHLGADEVLFLVESPRAFFALLLSSL